MTKILLSVDGAELVTVSTIYVQFYNLICKITQIKITIVKEMKILSLWTASVYTKTYEV